MTSEIRTLIQLSDIKGIEFQCPKCPAKILYPLGEFMDRVAQQCPNCNENWFQSNRPSDARLHVQQFVASVKSMASDKDIYAHIRLHVSCEGPKHEESLS